MTGGGHLIIFYSSGEIRIRLFIPIVEKYHASRISSAMSDARGYARCKMRAPGESAQRGLGDTDTVLRYVTDADRPRGAEGEQSRIKRTGSHKRAFRSGASLHATVRPPSFPYLPYASSRDAGDASYVLMLRARGMRDETVITVLIKRKSYHSIHS